MTNQKPVVKRPLHLWCNGSKMLAATLRTVWNVFGISSIIIYGCSFWVFWLYWCCTQTWWTESHGWPKSTGLVTILSLPMVTRCADAFVLNFQVTCFFFFFFYSFWWNEGKIVRKKKVDLYFMPPQMESSLAICGRFLGCEKTKQWLHIFKPAGMETAFTPILWAFSLLLRSHGL